MQTYRVRWVEAHLVPPKSSGDGSHTNGTTAMADAVLLAAIQDEASDTLHRPLVLLGGLDRSGQSALQSLLGYNVEVVWYTVHLCEAEAIEVIASL